MESNSLVAGLTSLSKICEFAGEPPSFIDQDTGRYGKHFRDITEEYKSLAPLLAEASSFLKTQPEVYVKSGGNIERLAVLNEAVKSIRQTIPNLILKPMQPPPTPASTEGRKKKNLLRNQENELDLAAAQFVLATAKRLWHSKASILSLLNELHL
jgi:hypothetical protein